MSLGACHQPRHGRVKALVGIATVGAFGPPEQGTLRPRVHCDTLPTQRSPPRGLQVIAPALKAAPTSEGDRLIKASNPLADALGSGLAARAHPEKSPAVGLAACCRNDQTRALTWDFDGGRYWDRGSRRSDRNYRLVINQLIALAVEMRVAAPMFGRMNTTNGFPRVLSAR